MATHWRKIITTQDNSDYKNSNINIVEDTTPQLGGALDTNGNDIQCRNNAIYLIPGTGDISNENTFKFEINESNELCIYKHDGNDFQLITKWS